MGKIRLTKKDVQELSITLELVDKTHYRGVLSSPKYGKYFYQAEFVPSTEGMDKGYVMMENGRETLLNADGESFYDFIEESALPGAYEAYLEKLHHHQDEMLRHNRHLYKDMVWESDEE